jgi:cytochrome c oxidase subunit IV
MEHHAPATRVYYIVYIALMILLLLTVGVHWLEWGIWGTVAALTLAVVKAVLVVLYFMHVRYSSRLVWVFALSGFIWLALLLGGLLSDYMSRGWLRG